MLPDSESEPGPVIYHASWQCPIPLNLASRKDLPVSPKDDQVSQADCTRSKQCASWYSNPAISPDLNKDGILPNLMQRKQKFHTSFSVLAPY